VAIAAILGEARTQREPDLPCCGFVADNKTSHRKSMKESGTQALLGLVTVLLAWELAKDSPIAAHHKTLTKQQAPPTMAQLEQGLSLALIAGKVQETQGWSGNYTVRVQEEYLRFLFLIGQGVSAVPSSAVDEVWHQHILTTRQYAKDCERLFGRFIHHLPSYTAEEHRALEAPRAAYFEAYEAAFGPPPADIWPGAAAVGGDCVGQCTKSCNNGCAHCASCYTPCSADHCRDS
jgi:hypothetical protein